MRYIYPNHLELLDTEVCQGTYIFFAAFCLLSFIWTYLLVPETSGKTLEQMDSVFGDSDTEIEQVRRKTIAKDMIRRHRMRL